MPLIDWGWNEYFEKQFEQFRSEGLQALRIVREDRSLYRAQGERGESVCKISGKFRHETAEKSGYPAVGDWVAVQAAEADPTGIIHAVLPRKSVFIRKSAGQKTEEQVVASNIDTSFIVTGLDDNYNLRRVERFLTLAWNSGSRPVIVLNKADICPEADARKIEVELAAPGADVIVTSAADHSGLDELQKYLAPGQTAVFLGSSGAGKSTLINALMGADLLKTSTVSELGSRGRHTTTARGLFPLPNGALVIDTPGMRELQVWGDDGGLSREFDDIEQIASGCRFQDCSHEKEPGCAVQQAIKNNTLDPERLKSYFKLKKEFAFLEGRQTEKSRWKSVSRLIKQMKKDGTL